MVRVHRRLDWPEWLTPPRSVPTSAAFYCVYRRRNAAAVSALIAQLDQPTVALWALDEPAEALADATLGVGPGAKFDLLNRLLKAAPPSPEQFAVVSDDDYHFVRGDFGRLLSICRTGGLGLAQPAHAEDSNYVHHVTLAQPRSRARRTRFVEIGPVFVVAPWEVHRLLPFPDDAGMGYGLDFAWYDAHPDLQMAVVDDVRIRHQAPVGSGYTSQALEEQEQFVLTPEWDARRSHERVGRPWRPWRLGPPWAVSAGDVRRSRTP